VHDNHAALALVCPAAQPRANALICGLVVARQRHVSLGDGAPRQVARIEAVDCVRLSVQEVRVRQARRRRRGAGAEWVRLALHAVA
jgi:hypothetical protein